MFKKKSNTFIEKKLAEWKERQLDLRKLQIPTDDFTFSLPFIPNYPRTNYPPLRFVGGIDISCGEDIAVICIVVVLIGKSEQSPKLIHKVSKEILLTEPYIAGYLAFREGPAIIQALEELKIQKPEIFPQLLLIQGNGLLHRRKFGLACHIGVVFGIPTVGVAKNLLFIRGEVEDRHVLAYQQMISNPGDSVEIRGFRDVNFVYGAIMKTNFQRVPYLYISSGHRVSIDSAVKLVRYFGGASGVPFPIRYADGYSRREMRRANR
ncbi:hypothetical protein HK098_000849 [Nowakowskiella sp. JEL0407]|nr:hypothetical protein HK098_000849 [Nowakowskiella sp. JEL0407]